MLGHSPFYYKLLRTYITYFGQVFNNIQIQRSDTQGNTQLVAVPIQYENMKKTVARFEEFSDLRDRDIAIITPKMAYSILTVDYDRQRAVSAMNKQYSKDGTVWAPAPYLITFDLSILVKSLEDGSMIIEQILPFFRTDFTARLRLPPFNDEYNIPIILNNTTLRDTFEGQGGDIRYIIWSLSFTMKAYFFGPVSNANTIMHIDLNFYNSLVSRNQTMNITLQQNEFQLGELVYQGNEYSNNAVGYVAAANTTALELNGTTGLFQNTAQNNILIYGIDSNTIASASNVAVKSIPNEIISIDGNTAPPTTTFTDNFE